MRFIVQALRQSELQVFFEPHGLEATIKEGESITVEWIGEWGEIAYTPHGVIIGRPSGGREISMRAWMPNGEELDLW
ncbi:hypothetical protein [Kitasatospora sp. NPDC057223]|uniref:hypothetical protein n=1 Tax=Kitasatospora sp. NPDC057223 TaxID=3346055 RepID=UPI00362E65E2